MAIGLGGACGDDPVDPEPVATAITIEPATATLKDAGETVQLTATVEDQNGDAMPGVAVTWSSSDLLIATVSQGGVVKGVEGGTATVTASVDSLAATATITVEPGPRAVLHTVYRKMNGDNWRDNTNWRSDEPLNTWHGVDTDAQGNVIALELQSNELAGAIAPELGILTELVTLILNENDLTGSIPPELGNLQKLRSLYLEQNDLTGSIPPELGNLTNLEGLSFSWNQLTGSIPSELGGLTNLGVLLLNDNGLTGAIPSGLGDLRNLTALRLDKNELTGSMPPELGNLSNVVGIRLEENDLTGSIPPELGNLTRLNVLDLTDNELTGPIPPELGTLGRLRSLGLTGNMLTGAVPGELGDLGSLRFLEIAGNPLSGPLPAELIRLDLWIFKWNNTDLCAPTDDDFQNWLNSIPDNEGNGNCISGKPSGNSGSGMIVPRG